jgi:hypothetical protein
VYVEQFSTQVTFPALLFAAREGKWKPRMFPPSSLYSLVRFKGRTMNPNDREKEPFLTDKGREMLRKITRLFSNEEQTDNHGKSACACRREMWSAAPPSSTPR